MSSILINGVPWVGGIASITAISSITSVGSVGSIGTLDSLGTASSLLTVGTMSSLQTVSTVQTLSTVGLVQNLSTVGTVTYVGTVSDGTMMPLSSSFYITGTATSSANDGSRMGSRNSPWGGRYVVITDEQLTMTPMLASLNALRNVVVNPDSIRQEIGMELFDGTGFATATYYRMIPMDGYKYFQMQYYFSCSSAANLSLWITHDPDSSEGSLTGWLPTTMGTVANVAGTSTDGGYGFGYPLACRALMAVMYVPNATNNLQIFVSRGN